MNCKYQLSVTQYNKTGVFCTICIYENDLTVDKNQALGNFCSYFHQYPILPLDKQMISNLD